MIMSYLSASFVTYSSAATSKSLLTPLHILDNGNVAFTTCESGPTPYPGRADATTRKFANATFLARLFVTA